ncbi:MAG: isocitrate/isopropylmalate family dehydrogenase [Myxococcales bacterium]|nr:isocitrate/isopropylmalate family dehydrogenase [Myxococcales bacterium]
MSQANASRKRVVVIEGEDAAPEAMAPTLELIDALGLPIDWLHPQVGAAAKAAHGTTFPAQAREAIDAADATFFGATSGPSVAALFYLRWGKETFANVRPARYMPGCKSPLAHPEGVDLVIVRENLEDLYLGLEGEIGELEGLGLKSRTSRRPLSDYAPARYAIKVLSDEGSLRVLRFSFELARKRRLQGHAGSLTCATKYNMLPVSDGRFRELALEMSADYPDVPLSTPIIDDFGHQLVTRPHQLDVVVMPNLYGDIMSDTAAGLVGGLGLAPSGCYGEGYAYFESAHGTAPDIAGRGIINPSATILSGAMLLQYLGFEPAAERLRRALEAVYAAGRVSTPDQGGSASTVEFCRAIADKL